MLLPFVVALEGDAQHLRVEKRPVELQELVRRVSYRPHLPALVQAFQKRQYQLHYAKRRNPAYCNFSLLPLYWSFKPLRFSSVLNSSVSGRSSW